MPERRLKNLPKADWSEKFRIDVISCMESFDVASSDRASLYSMPKMKSEALCPVMRFMINDR